MSVSNNVLKVIKEGKAHINVPKTVFYNPVQEFNRDLSVLVLKTYLKHNVWHHRNEQKHVIGRGGLKILDALSASGLRSIRYAKELGQCDEIVKSIVANDLSKEAVELINKNIELNEVGHKVTSSLNDAGSVLHNSANSYDTRFHVIDLDPFGTAAQFFNAAVGAIGEAGLLMVTCTDTAVLCGNASETCFARYGSMSLRGEFCHDSALRIILRSIESQAATYGRYVKPLLSVSVDFYIRVFVQIFTQAAETKKTASKLSQVYLCRECKTTETNVLGVHTVKEDPKQAASKNPAVKYNFKPAQVSVGDRCRICNGHYTIGGPIWSDPIHDVNFLSLLKQELDLPEAQEQFKTFNRMKGLVYMCSEELPDPLMYSIDHISSILKIKMPRSRDVLSALVNAGYKVSATHTNDRGFKTNAPSNVVWDIFCQIADKQHKSQSVEQGIVEQPSAELSDANSLPARIMGRPRDKIYDLTFNPAIQGESEKLSLLRFQINPAKFWGPKPRPEKRKRSDSNSDNQPDAGQPIDS